jgi:mRNA interferase YafQ
MYILKQTTQFKKDLKKIIKKSSKDSKLIKETIIILKMNGVNGILTKRKLYKLKGKYTDNWECHIKPDLLIIWIQIESPKIIKLIRIGSHSDLFK